MHSDSSTTRAPGARPCSYHCGASVTGTRHNCKVCQKRASDFAQALYYGADRPTFRAALYDVLSAGAKRPAWREHTAALRALLLRLANYTRANGGEVVSAAATDPRADAAHAARLQSSLRRAVKFPGFERALAGAVNARLGVPRTAAPVLFGAASRGVLGGGQ